MAGLNVSIYVTKADEERLRELGLEPRIWARDTIKSALAKLDLPALTDEENQELEESEGPPSKLPVVEHVQPLDKDTTIYPSGLLDLDTNGEEQDWVARLRNRAYPDGVPE